MAELRFHEAAAAGYDRAVGRSTGQSIPALLRAPRLAPGQRVLDIATGTGLVAEAAAAAIGPTGSVEAAASCGLAPRPCSRSPTATRAARW